MALPSSISSPVAAPQRGARRAGWPLAALCCGALGCTSSTPGTDGGAAADAKLCRDLSGRSSEGCASYTARGSLGALPSTSLSEVSGIVASRSNPGVVWVHNDSGGLPEVYAIAVSTTAAPQLIATVQLTGATNTDWEDLAIGPSPSGSGDFLYIGDTGDNVTNSPRRSGIQIYRIPEPRLDLTKTNQIVGIPAGKVERIELTYPGGVASDCEAMFVDPTTAELYLISKNLAGPSYVYTAAAVSAPPKSPIELRPLLSCDGLPRPLQFPYLNVIVTGATISPSGRGIALRAYSGAFLWERAPTESIAEVFAHTACELPFAAERQGEAIAWTADGRGYYTVSEGAKEEIHYFTNP